jgi:dimeric dUTPase (all-alpha-NTP-PPase superfamily)
LSTTPTLTAAATQILEMLDLQDAMNQRVNPEWRTAGYAWHRAIYVESTELLNHLGNWTWWKKLPADLPQAQMELVDIFHFGISLLMVAEPTTPRGMLAQDLAVRLEQAVQTYRERGLADEEGVNELIDNLVGWAASGIFNVEAFGGLLHNLGMSPMSLYKWYIGKNALNRFRQNHGYKTGAYHKTWHGEEDNVHLEHILGSFAVTEAGLFDRVYSALEGVYTSVLASAGVDD